MSDKDVDARCSGVWLPPPKYRNNEASNQASHLDSHFNPVPDRCGVSVNGTIRPPVEKIRIEDRDFSLGKAMPQIADAIETQIDCDDARDDFIKEKPHSKSLEHDPEKWKPVSRLREARFGGRRKVGKDHAQTQNLDPDPIQLNWIRV
jgi:hypothetical protein